MSIRLLGSRATVHDEPHFVNTPPLAKIGGGWRGGGMERKNRKWLNTKTGLGFVFHLTAQSQWHPLLYFYIIIIIILFMF